MLSGCYSVHALTAKQAPHTGTSGPWLRQAEQSNGTLEATAWTAACIQPGEYETPQGRFRDLRSSHAQVACCELNQLAHGAFGSALVEV